MTCDAIMEESINVKTKMVLITGLGKTIKPNRKEGARKSIWPQINNNLKEKLKDTGYWALISKNESIKRAAAKLIADLFAVERIYSEQNEWTDIVKNLTSNMENSDSDIQKAAIFALNFICENIQEDKRIKVYEKEL